MAVGCSAFREPIAANVADPPESQNLQVNPIRLEQPEPSADFVEVFESLCDQGLPTRKYLEFGILSGTYSQNTEVKRP